jgi:hypothetical protein
VTLFDSARHRLARPRVVHNAGLTLLVCQTRHKGRGVFAASFIPRGSLVVKFEGQVLRAKDIPPDWFALQIEEDSWLCSDGSLLDDCVNHSCDANTGFAGQDATLYALRDILPGEELSWDYSTSISEPGWSLVCSCGSKCCRHVILPFDDLGPEEQARLRPIALRYLRSRGRAGS